MSDTQMPNYNVLLGANSSFYFSMCKEHKELISNYQKEMEAAKNEWEESLIDDKINRSRAILIVFGVMTLESYINQYAISYLPSRNFFTTYVDQLSLLNKWVLVPQLTVSEPFPTHENVFKQLKDLIKARNFLVHNMPLTLAENDKDQGKAIYDKHEKFFNGYKKIVEVSNNVCDLIEDILNELQKIHPVEPKHSLLVIGRTPEEIVKSLENLSNS